MSDTGIHIRATVTAVGGDLVGQEGESAGAFIRTREIPGIVVAESEDRCVELLDELFSLAGETLMRYGGPLTAAYLSSRGVSHHITVADPPELEEGQFRHEAALV